MKNIKYFLLAALLTVLILPSFASAMTTEEIIAKIKDLQQQIEQLKAELSQIQGQAPVWCYDFRENLKIGTKGEGAAALHIILEKEGFSVFDEEKANKEFGESTASVVSGLQQKYQDEILAPLGLKYGTGFLGKATRTKLNTLYGCGVKATPAPFCSPVAASCESGSKSKIVCPPGLDNKGCPFPCKCVPVACTQEAKVCPDGSTVSRIPPLCGFAACPNQTINQPPVIYGIEGPTFLKVNEIGFWTIKASDPENGHLVYSVEWGDGSAAQTATFTHSYPKAGIYSPTFIVTDKENLSAKNSITVKIEETISPDIIYEQVKCVFNGSQTEQKCYTSGETYSGYGCSGIETCVTDVKGRKGDKLTWKSSCGGYAYTTMDGQNEYAEFKCILPVSTPAPTPTTPPSAVGTGTRKFKPIDPSRCPGTIETSCTIEPANIIKVSVYDEKGIHVDTRENNNSGMAGFLDLPYGNYTVVINAEGFESYKALFTVCATCEAITTIYLKKTSTFSTSPSIIVLSPNGGELWEIGKTYTIQWKSENLPSGNNITIELLGSSGTKVLFSSIANNASSQNWTISKDFPLGTYILKVISYAFSCGGSSSSCSDDTERPFSVTATTVAKTCAELEPSQKYYFNICSDAGYDNVCLNKFTDIYQGCTKNTRNDCTQSNANAEQNILCPVPVTQKSITVLYPNGGESWKIGNTYEIKWTTTGYSPDGVVRIIITDESSGTENPLFNAYNKGIFSWTVPSTYQAHSNYKIKIIAPDEKYDKSDAPFSIVSLQPTEPTSCTDSDKGNDIYLKGCTTYLISGGAKETVCDFCRESYIQEYFCQDNKMAYSIQNCPNGCQDGVCLATPATGLKRIENLLASISQVISQLSEQIKKLIGR